MATGIALVWTLFIAQCIGENCNLHVKYGLTSQKACLAWEHSSEVLSRRLAGKKYSYQVYFRCTPAVGRHI